jgi:phosphomannomutase
MDRLMVSVSGVRGTVGGSLTPQTACDFGCAFATMLGAGKRVTVARDSRPSGHTIRNAVVAGLTSCGASVTDLGLVATPTAAYMTKTSGAGGGVVITASHNPAPYNGIKFLQPHGPGLTAQAALELKALWESRKYAYADALGQGTECRDTTAHGSHVAAVCGTIDLTLVASKRFKVVLDSINGAGCVASPMLLGKLGCELAHINAQPNGQFAHEPEPVQANLAGLCEAVRKHKAHVGFAQDPDADRLVVVDEQGRFIGEEYTLALAAALVLRHRKGDLAANLATSRMIDDIASQAGVKVHRAPTGEANVAALMERTGCIFGGEGNGGVIEPRVVAVRDSLVGMAYILQYLAETGKPLSALVAQIPPYVMVKAKFSAPAGVAPAVAAATRKAFALRGDAKFNEEDGLRVDLPEGWVSVRASNTEPIMRVMGEARQADVANGLVGQVRKIAEETIASMG